MGSRKRGLMTRAKQEVLLLLGPLPHIQHHNTATGAALPWGIPKALPLTTKQVSQDKTNGPNARTDQRPRKNTTNQWTDRKSIRCRVQNTGNQDAHRNGWAWLQNRVKSEGYEKWNKGKCTGKQQWQEGNRDSDQWFGSQGRNKHSTTTEWRNKNSNKMRRGLGILGQL